MNTSMDFVAYGLSVILLAVYSGAFTALERLSLRGSEADDAEGSGGVFDDVLDDPVQAGLALVLARGACMLGVIATALRLAETGGVTGGGHLVAAAVVAGSLFVPVQVGAITAHRGPERFLRAFRHVILPTVYLVRPLAAMARAGRQGGGLSRALTYPVMPLKDKLDAGVPDDGQPGGEEQRIMSSLLEFGETRVREVMVPRIDVVAIAATMAREDALDVIIEAGHSRIPVYEETIDRIVGVLYTKDLLRAIVSRRDFTWRDLVREPFYVPESKRIDELLSEFRARRQHLAIVVDEYGGTAGIVTLEDVIEEIVGDIQDEFDTEEAPVRRVDDDTAVCSGRAHLDEINEVLGIDLDDDEADSVGGLIYHAIGRVPRVGDAWERGPLRMTVEAVDRQRIRTVRITGIAAARRQREAGGA